MKTLYATVTLARGVCKKEKREAPGGSNGPSGPRMLRPLIKLRPVWLNFIFVKYEYTYTVTL